MNFMLGYYITIHLIQRLIESGLDVEREPI